MRLLRAYLLLALICVQSVNAAPAPYDAELLVRDDDVSTSRASGFSWADNDATVVDGSAKELYEDADPAADDFDAYWSTESSLEADNDDHGDSTENNVVESSGNQRLRTNDVDVDGSAANEIDDLWDLFDYYDGSWDTYAHILEEWNS